MEEAIQKLLKAVGRVNSLLHYHLNHRSPKILVWVVGILLDRDAVADENSHRALGSRGFGSGAGVVFVEREGAVLISAGA